MRFALALSTAAIFMSLPAPAFSQTAEETVAFLLYALEEGKTPDRPSLHTYITSRSPARYEVRGSDEKYKEKVDIYKKSNCIYNVIIATNSDYSSYSSSDYQEFIIDFTDLKGAKFDYQNSKSEEYGYDFSTAYFTG